MGTALVRRKRQRKEAPRVVHPAGSPEARRLVRAFADQQARYRTGQSEIALMLSRLNRTGRRRWL